MKQQLFVWSVSMMWIGCAGAPGSQTTPEVTRTVSDDVTIVDPVSEAPEATQTVPTIQPGYEPSTRTSRKKQRCTISPEADQVQMVMSQDDDWFFYASETAQIDCTSIGGKVQVDDGVMTVKMRILVPEDGANKEIGATLRDQDATFLKRDLDKTYGDGKKLAFEDVKLGQFKRPALCADGDIRIDGTPGRVVACITSTTTINDEIIIHRVVWVDSVDQYDSKMTPRLVKEQAANWFRYSDTNGIGKIQHRW